MQACLLIIKQVSIPFERYCKVGFTSLRNTIISINSKEGFDTPHVFYSKSDM